VAAPHRRRRFRLPAAWAPTAVAAVAAFAALAALAFLAPGCAAPRIVVPMAPPAVRGEVRPRRPGPSWVWVPGCWQWQGDRHAWVPGHWTRGRAGKNWSPGHWKRAPGGWVWAPGKWVAA
jgi:WXXGXW repeat (2 copies)